MFSVFHTPRWEIDNKGWLQKRRYQAIKKYPVLYIFLLELYNSELYNSEGIGQNRMINAIFNKDGVL